MLVGLLSIRGVTRGSAALGIPNQTVKRLMYGYLRDAWDDPRVRYIGMALVFHGWELAWCEAVSLP